jgi:hypothetical protein
MRPSLSSRTTEGEIVELDRALTELRRQAVRDGWVGRPPDPRPLTFRKVKKDGERKGRETEVLWMNFDPETGADANGREG